MEIIDSNNLWSMSVNRLVSLLSEAYYNEYKKNRLNMTNFPSVMLWGPPGVGKSQGIKQIAKNLERLTGLEVHVTDVRLLLFNPIDLRGIPVANKNNNSAVWLKPKIFQLNPFECINILFLDEISAAPQSVQAAAYQLTLERKIGEHSLPENTIVIAAGNRVTDKSVATRMPKALANRLLHIEVESDVSSWLSWAIENDINEKVFGYLSQNRYQLFKFDVDSDELAFPTPRSWEMVSRVIDNFNGDHIKSYPLIAGLIGRPLALEFKTWCSIYKDLPNIDDIFSGTEINIPKKPDELFALVASLTSRAKEYKYDAIKIGNSINYASRMPIDFTELLLQNYSLLDKDYDSFLKQIPEYQSYVSKRGGNRNGRI